MQRDIKIKKRWLATVLKEAETLSEPMPWQRRRQTLSSIARDAPAQTRSGPLRA